MSSSWGGCKAQQRPGDFSILSFHQGAAGWCVMMGLELNLQLLGTERAGAVGRQCFSSQYMHQPLPNPSSQHFPSPFCQSSCW